MATKGIKGAQIHATGGRPKNLHNPTHLIHGSPKSVGNVKGGPDLGGRGGKEYFMGTQNKPAINTGKANQIVEARGKHLA